MWTRRCWTITFGIECEAETKGITDRGPSCVMEKWSYEYGATVDLFIEPASY